MRSRSWRRRLVLWAGNADACIDRAEPEYDFFARTESLYGGRMKKPLRDALQRYAADVPHLAADDLFSEIKARERKGATEGECMSLARTIVIEHERAAVLHMGRARVSLISALTRLGST